MHDGRAAAAPRALKLKWTTLFSYLFFGGKHINFLELESPSFVRRVARGGIRARRLLVLVDSRGVLGAVSKGRPSSRKINFLLRKQKFWCVVYDIALELVMGALGRIQRMPLHGTNRSKIGMHHYRSSRLLRPQSSRQFMPLRN